jgi:hypothetical protein
VRSSLQSASIKSEKEFRCAAAVDSDNPMPALPIFSHDIDHGLYIFVHYSPQSKWILEVEYGRSLHDATNCWDGESL